MFFHNVKLEPGEYWVALEVSRDGEVIYKNRYLQKVKEIIPVITSEDLISPEGLIPPLADEGEPDITMPSTDQILSDVGLDTQPTKKTDYLYLIFAVTALVAVFMLYILYL